MNQNKALLCVLTAAVLCVNAPVAKAQEIGPLIEEITVTATKRAQSIYEVPIAMSAFQGEDLAKQGVVDIVDIGKFVPNLNITQFSAGHNSSANAFIRGIGLQDHLITTDPGVSVYVDGVYLGRQVGQNWNLSNLERVEVLRGPQGTLYGRNSIGGAINIITKTPGTDEGAKVSVEIGSRGRLNGDFYGDMALSDNVAVSLTGGYKHRDGIGDFLNLPNAGVEVGEMTEVYARLAMRYAPNDDFSLVITADANDGEGGLRPYTTLIDELPNGAVYGAGYRNSDLASDPYDNNTGQASQALVTNEAWGVAATADYAFSDSLATKIIASHRSSEYKSGLDDDGFSDDFLSFPELGDADQTSIEVQLNGDMGAWDFVSGVYYFTEEGGNFQDPTTFLTFPGFFILDQEVTSVAVFGNVGYNVSDDFRISGGLRVTNDEKDVVANVSTGFFSASEDFDEVSWELAANYTLSGGMNLYGTIQNGYQSGQFPARPFCLFGGTVVGCLEASDNITATNYEVGIKGQPFDRLQISAALFFTQYDDLPYQVSETTATGFDTSNLIVEQDSFGFEWESTAFITENFLFHATLGYIDVDVEDQVNATGDTVTPVAPLTPELTFSISPEARIPTDGGGEIVLRADYSYRDEMYGEPSSDPGRFTQIDSRGLVNFDIAYHSPDASWSAALYGRNVTDEEYDNARLNTGDYVLVMLNNDASEFGLRLSKRF
ncbi:MAG: TonB-dependent receptor [Gammaproteobacteria bacterium]|nr:TonB-dependent receptor [Gammaproteobacteria bacterium]